MGQTVGARVRGMARGVLKWLVGVPVVRRLYYSIRNSQEFEELWWHDLMLADDVRMSTYARAIDELVPEGSVVVDVGTGTGVLACMASRRARKVYAVEHSSLIERARLLASSNGITNIEFVASHSRELSPPEQVDVLLHEQIGMNLIDEDMIANLGDLRRRILRPGGTILPGRFELHVAPVSLKADRRIPWVHEQKLHGLDFSALEEVNRPQILARSLDRQLVDPRDVESTLAPQVTLFALDLSTDEGSSVPSETSASFVVDDDATLDGFAVFFTVEFSPEIRFDTGPSSPWTHWQLQLYRTGQRPVTSGDRLDFSLAITSPTDASAWTWTHAIGPS